MSIDTALGLLAVILLIAANGVFVAAEFALVAADRSRVEALAEDGSRRARLVATLLRRLSLELSGAQLGITVTSLLLGFLAGPVIAQLLEPVLRPLIGESLVRGVSIAVAFLVATVLQMVVGELTPKTVAIAKPETAALWLAPFLQVYGTLFGPIIRLLNHAANWTVRRLGVEPKEELESVRSLSELARLLSASAEEGTIGGNASSLFARSVRFADKTAADALVPRVRVSAVAVDDCASDLVDLAARTGFSRFPVYRVDLDDIVGVVLVKIVHGLAPGLRATTPIGEIMSEVVVVPETRSLQGLLADMRTARNHLAVVVDEYGGTAGIITLEDVIEEIVGEIDDEYDRQEPRLTDVGRAQGPWLLSGSLHPDEVGEATGFEPPEGEYETLAGFVLDRLGRIPDEGDRFVFDGWQLEVAAMDGLRVATVAIEREGPLPDAADPTGSDSDDPADDEGGAS
jgi:CBS domain containing-hemolysin-like protein